jgi:Tc toxin complex TcA C-terminal TcB-binding domain/ABC toxin N-terminal region/Neuraminidase-like domain
MKPIIPPINTGDSGPLVANLQDALLALLGPEHGIIQALDAPNRPTLEELKKLTAGLRKERAQSLFGEATRQLILYFQVQQGLGDNLRGIVEDKTAARLNEWLKKAGMLEEEMTCVVRGRITGAGKGQMVRAWDKDLRSEELLGEAPAGSDYEIRYSPQKFKGAEKGTADLRVAVYNSDGKELLSSGIFFNAAPDMTVNLEMTEGLPPALSEYESYLADLGPVLQDVTLIEIDRQPPEPRAKDLAFLAGDTGIELQRIEWLVQAAACEEKSRSVDPAIHTHVAYIFIPAAVFYGLFREGLKPDFAVLLAAPTGTLVTKYRAAMDQHIVPRVGGDDLERITARIEQLKLEFALQAPRSGTPSSLGALLGTLPAPPSPDQQRAIAAVAAELRPDDPQLVNRIRETPGFTGDAVGVARTLRLSALTGDHLPMVQALQPYLAEDREGALRPLASLGAGKLLDLAYTYGAPDAQAITPAAYADAVAAGIERQHPTAVLIAHVTDGGRLTQHPMLADLEPFLHDNPDFDIVTANLNAITEQANLRGVRDPKLLVKGMQALQQLNRAGVRWSEAPAFLEQGVYAPQHFLAAGPTQLKALFNEHLAPERVATLYGNVEDLHHTTFAALTAATAPFSGPRILPNPGAIPTGGDPVTNDPRVDPVFNPAQVTLLPPQLGVVPRGMPPEAVVKPVFPEDIHLPPGSADAINRQPTLQSLFGAQDACACGHCSSVLSPAAYFVDVLQFIRNAGMLGEIAGNGGLLARRPDLQDIELSCDNTNTEVPAIDLALEILENAVALPLEVPLPAGTDAEKELSGNIVGDHVRTALQSTVRNLSGTVRATPAGSHEAGTTDWTVVDGHRRWTLTLKNRVLRAATATGTARMIDTTGLDQAALIASLDQGHVSSGAESAFARLLAPNRTQPPDIANYALTITPLVAGQSWRVSWLIVVKLLVDAAANRLVLQTAAGTNWAEQVFNLKTMEAVTKELARGIVPDVVQVLMAKRFSETRKLTLKPAGAQAWTIESARRDLTLGFTTAGLTITSLAYQSGDAGADAIAWPENHNPAAYLRLKGDPAAAIPIPVPVFPWSLPVDLPLEEVRLFLDRARSSRRRLVELTVPVDQLQRNERRFALEVIGLNEAEAGIIAPQTPWPDSEIYKQWGLASNATSVFDVSTGRLFVKTGPLALLSNVAILLQQSRLSFEDLQAILATRFLSSAGTNPLSITPPGTCIPSEMTLNGLTAAHLDRIHRFERIRRRLGWAAQDLDAAIQIAPAGELNSATLLRLAHLVRLRELLNLPLAAILAWWSDPAGRIPALARGLGLTTGELAHALALFTMVETDAFASPGDTLGFCERVMDLSRTGIPFEDLRYLLQHFQTPVSRVALDEQQLAQLAGSARAAARSILDAQPDVQPPAAPESIAAATAVRRNREDATTAALAAGLGVAPELVDDLLRTRLRHPADAAKAAIDVFSDASFLAGAAGQPLAASVRSVLVRLHKTVFLQDALKLGMAGLQLLRQPAPATDKNGFTALDFNSLPDQWVAAPLPADIENFKKVVADFERLAALVHLHDIAPGAGDLLRQYAALDFTDAAIVQKARQAVADGLAVDSGEVERGAEQLKITTAAQHRDPVALSRLIALLAELRQLGATTSQAADFAAASPDDAAALAAHELLQSKYSDSSWQDLIKPIADKLRERQRDALVDYLVARNHLRGADDLYELYLIDVQTSSCFKTTRLLQATAAAQLYVQRLFLNLEGHASLGPEKRDLWDWMQSYRVWEANRKVFLFPENWLLPELRDDKTVIFRQMESALTEQEPSPEATRAALLGYVDALGDLAQISVIAMYQDQRIAGLDAQNRNIVEHTLFIIGRTPDQPYRYFWRSCANFGRNGMSWSGWEPLDLDNANDFILPFVFEGDLHVAWPIFRKTKEEQDESNLRWEVQIAWTRRTHQGWVRRKLSKPQLTVSRLANKDADASFVFRLSKANSEALPGSNINPPLTREIIHIACYAANEDHPIRTIQVDPALDVLNHSGENANNLWNANLTVRGTLYQYATVDNENTTKTLPLSNVLVNLFYWQRFRENDPGGDVKEFVAPPTRTDANGRFSISIATQADDKAGVFRGSTVRLVLYVQNGASSYVERVSRDLGTTATGFFKSWTWEVNVGVKNDALKQQFLPDRHVNYLEAGSFILESGRDLRCDPALSAMLSDAPGILDLAPPPSIFREMAFDRNGFTTSGSVIPNVSLIFLGAATWSPPRALKSPIFIVRATQSPSLEGASEPYAWYVQDNDGGFYLQRVPNDWGRWPDGEPFAPTYRIAATLSTSALFQPSLEAHVHVDSLANNFLRQFPYANYNWELFFHAPLAIADYLASQQRFEEARRWLHTVFDPTAEQTPGMVPQYWRFLPFDNTRQPDAIGKLLAWLANPNMADPEDTADFEDKLKSQIEEWKKNPFMPHLIARLRPSAYQWYTFFAYLDMLINWGDQLFRRDTRESVNEATLLYILAAKLLGPRPRTIPRPTVPPPLTYRSLEATELDGFSNAWVTYSGLPGMRTLSATRQAMTAAAPGAGATDRIEKIPFQGHQILTSLSALAFCIPQNDKLTEFYDRIDNRLFNIRHCRNIDGVPRDLPLFDPPIDPLLLIRAKAAGLDLGSVIAGLYAPLPNYRFSFSLQKALELAAELKSLGGALLATLEKQDTEALALLRSSHEITLLNLVREVRQQQLDETEANIVALQQSKDTTLERFNQFQKLLGKTGISKGQDGLPVVEQSSSLSVSTDAVGGASGLGLIRKELSQLALTSEANVFTQIANEAHVLAGVLSIIPNVWGGDALVAGSTFGGSNLGSAASALGKAIEMFAVDAGYSANVMGTFAGYERRQDEWVYQSKVAVAELRQIDKQILAAKIRKEIARLELRNHDVQIENAQKVDDFIRGKFTSQQLYRWMSSRIAEVYFRTWQLALDQARRAERTYQFELGLDANTTPFIQNDSWDNLKKGLMAGDRLYNDLKRMESAHQNQNRREFELTKHISLALANPLALVTLRETGQCVFSLPEEIFDLDYPGHYFRRIKSVSLTLPCVVGPYTTIACTLRLLKNSIRMKAGIDNGYPRNTDAQGVPTDDVRFVENNVPVKAIAASNAQNDSGVFELTFRDERYLPFEGAGAISNWSLELFSDDSPDFGRGLRQFDYNTISDAILHIKYTAREDAGTFKNAAIANLRNYLKQAGAQPPQPLPPRMFNLRQEFPAQWHRFLNPANAANGNVFELEMSPGLFPFRDGGQTPKINTIVLLARSTNAGPLMVVMSPPLPAAPAGTNTMTLTRNGAFGDLHFGQKGDKDHPLGLAVSSTAPPVKWQLKITRQTPANSALEIEDLMLILGYQWA